MSATESDAAEIMTAQNAAQAVWGGLQNPGGPREQEAQSVMDSDQGYGDFNVLAGYSGDWPNDASPPDSVDNGGYGGA